MNLSFSHPRIALAPENLRYNPCNDVIFPCVVKIGNSNTNALGAYYMYYAPHDPPGGICLAYADSLEGSWTEFAENPLISRHWAPHYEVSHVSSPHMLWMEAESKFFLYFHGENDTTRLATSADGIHFDYEGIAVTTAMFDGISEASYARVFHCDIASKEAHYVMLFMGNNGGTRRIYAAWSRDGRTFEAQRTPLINPPPGTGVTQVGAPWYFPRNGRNTVIFHGDQTDAKLSDVTTDLYIADLGPDFTSEEHLGLFYRRQNMADDNKRASDPCLIEDEGRYWLFFSVGARLRQAIAQAHELF